MIKKTRLQTHARMYKSDKLKLKSYMRRNIIKSEAEALKKLLRRLK